MIIFGKNESNRCFSYYWVHPKSYQSLVSINSMRKAKSKMANFQHISQSHNLLPWNCVLNPNFNIFPQLPPTMAMFISWGIELWFWEYEWNACAMLWSASGPCQRSWPIYKFNQGRHFWGNLHQHCFFLVQLDLLIDAGLEIVHQHSFHINFWDFYELGWFLY